MNTTTTAPAANEVTTAEMNAAAAAASVAVANATPRTLKIAHQQWASRPDDERFESLDALQAAVEARMECSREVVADAHDISASVSEDGLRVMLEGNEELLDPTNWSFGQLASFADFRASELRKLTPETAAIVLNERLGNTDPGKEVKLMKVLSDSGDTRLQAVTGAGYGRIFDAEVVRMVQNVVAQSDGKFYNPKAYAAGEFGAEAVPSGLYASDRDVFMFMIDGGSIFERGDRMALHRGFIVSNSEVGKASLCIMSFMFNQVCGNHFIFGAQDINIKRIIHSSGAPDRFARDAFDELRQFAEAPIPSDIFVRASEIKLDDLPLDGIDRIKDADKWAKAFGTRYGFSAGSVREAVMVALREEGRCDTVFDLAQGFTASARTIPHVDTRVEFERKVGAWMERMTK